MRLNPMALTVDQISQIRLKYNLDWKDVAYSFLMQAIILFAHNYLFDPYSYTIILYELIFFAFYSLALDDEYGFLQNIIRQYNGLMSLILLIIFVFGFFYIYSIDRYGVMFYILIFGHALLPLLHLDEENDKAIYWRDRLEKYEKNLKH